MSDNTGTMEANKLIKLGFLDANCTALLACDIQETSRKSITRFNTLVIVANRMAAASNLLNVPLYVSEHYLLGPSAKEFNKENAVLVYEKNTFSMATPTLFDDINKRFPNKLESVILFGLEAHICIEQTAMDFLNRDIAVHILADGCVSRAQHDRVFALQRLRDIGCHITTSESVLFKLMKDDHHPKYKEISDLVEESIPDTFELESISIL